MKHMDINKLEYQPNCEVKYSWLHFCLVSGSSAKTNAVVVDPVKSIKPSKPNTVND